MRLDENELHIVRYFIPVISLDLHNNPMRQVFSSLAIVLTWKI